MFCDGNPEPYKNGAAQTPDIALQGFREVKFFSKELDKYV